MKSLFQTGILGINHVMITKFLKSFDNSQKKKKIENIKIERNQITK